MKINKGFTLIELLVVIAIIGILSSVVLASLNASRSKGSDAAAKSNLSTVRTQSIIYYDANNYSYNSASGSGLVTAPTSVGCAATGAFFNDPIITAALVAADKAAGGNATDLATLSKVVCQIGSTNTNANYNITTTRAKVWTVYVPTANNIGSNTGWCVDSTGIAKATTIPVANVVSCP